MDENNDSSPTAEELKEALGAVEGASRPSRRRARVVPIRPTASTPPVQEARELPLTSTQKVGFQSLIEKQEALNRARYQFLAECLREQGVDPDSKTLDIKFQGEKLSFIITPVAG